MAGDGVVIRIAGDGDGDSLVEAWDDVRDYYATRDAGVFQAPDPRHPVDATEFVRSLREADEASRGFARVAEVEGRVVGYIVARLDEPMVNAAEQLTRDLGVLRGYVEAVGVHRTYWRRGVGRALMAAAEAWAREQGAAVMKTDTNYHSPVSVPFYESLGYDRQAIIFRKPL
jgi:aminoglycoside 6'-N-acetyltransferase I